MQLAPARRDALAAGLAAAAASGVPSTLWTLARRGNVLAGGRAAGALLLPDEKRTLPLLAAAVPVHVALSLGWAVVLEELMPARREPLYGAAAGLAIAAIDLGIIGRRIGAIRDLEQPPQWLDHVAYGVSVGVVLRSRRRRRAQT
jgi:hypothetical protein